jgi:hypothetical protein
MFLILRGHISVFNESVQEICGFHVQLYSLSWICMYIYQILKRHFETKH